jgi:hypothetical protein
MLGAAQTPAPNRLAGRRVTPGTAMQTPAANAAGNSGFMTISDE